ncbi:hypothetical protein Riv7116_6353 [Rivularia sp. PCC 7116]|uniref:S-layer family protein n=1 Tax=Rivularia sp. PCC 7116 TaxID=373994 RepID=UPI00029F49A7|nr:S-layer family protein [Rivularia sp. PCC 7116]AFY58695.1 hypothetical protein Riv7116_6353 [Rivularia sp. PCC 7116]
MTIETENLTVGSLSQVVTATAGDGNAGKLDITAEQIIINQQGNGGNINIATPGLFGIDFRDKRSLMPSALRNTPQSDITASSEFGVDGDFNLDLTAVDPNNGLIELPENLTDAADRISAGCPTDEEARFVTTGRGGIPVNPRQTLREEIVLQDLRDNNSTLSTPSSPSSPSTPPKLKKLPVGLLTKMEILNLLLIIFTRSVWIFKVRLLPTTVKKLNRSGD